MLDLQRRLGDSGVAGDVRGSVSATVSVWWLYTSRAL